MKIPIFCGERHLGFCRDEASLRRYQKASNTEIVRQRKSSNVVRIVVSAVLEDEDSGRGIGPNSAHPTYEDDLPTGPLTTLKRVNQFGQFERWSSKDGFNPRRFNPDRLPVSRFAVPA